MNSMGSGSYQRSGEGSTITFARKLPEKEDRPFILTTEKDMWRRSGGGRGTCIFLLKKRRSSREGEENPSCRGHGGFVIGIATLDTRGGRNTRAEKDVRGSASYHVGVGLWLIFVGSPSRYLIKERAVCLRKIGERKRKNFLRRGGTVKTYYRAKKAPLPFNGEAHFRRRKSINRRVKKALGQRKEEFSFGEKRVTENVFRRKVAFSCRDIGKRKTDREEKGKEISLTTKGNLSCRERGARGVETCPTRAKDREKEYIFRKLYKERPRSVSAGASSDKREGKGARNGILGRYNSRKGGGNVSRNRERLK